MALLVAQHNGKRVAENVKWLFFMKPGMYGHVDLERLIICNFF
ncbi:hypothetical protein XCR1_1040045 [Xenorhabdus cabanillasii JM26]|uniref:Uncharacterized protein n=1 Tax=Xenorhabdus cabanillasii JM26 TaxID=1427517 RepID=W1IPG4_9GAMM|nr:hypothetical protein XCR1_1040045 [Xenorhabdus cabanillasii JM26]